MLNFPDYVDIGPSEVHEGDIKLVRHRRCPTIRGIELLIEEFSDTREVGALHLVISRAPTIDLRALASKLGIPGNCTLFHDFVLPEHLVVFLNRYDVSCLSPGCG